MRQPIPSISGNWWRLRKHNPDLKNTESLWVGWTWSKNFSDAVLTDSSTYYFAKSAVDIVNTI
jgi:chitinase